MTSEEAIINGSEFAMDNGINITLKELKEYNVLISKREKEEKNEKDFNGTVYEVDKSTMS